MSREEEEEVEGRRKEEEVEDGRKEGVEGVRGRSPRPSVQSPTNTLPPSVTRLSPT